MSTLVRFPDDERFDSSKIFELATKGCSEPETTNPGCTLMANREPHEQEGVTKMLVVKGILQRFSESYGAAYNCAEETSSTGDEYVCTSEAKKAISTFHQELEAAKSQVDGIQDLLDLNPVDGSRTGLRLAYIEQEKRAS